MRKNNKVLNFAHDTESSIYNGQTKTEVWASAFCPYRTNHDMKKGKRKPKREDVKIFGSLKDSYDWLNSLDSDITAGVHNLKWDGHFHVYYLEKGRGYQYHEPKSRKDLQPKTYHALIGEMGQWYSLTVILENGHQVTFYDTLKLIPFSLKKAGKDFGTEHQKLEMTYTGERYENCLITAKEREYIENDVLVLAELLEKLEERGLNKMTIASCAAADYKKRIGTNYQAESFMDLSKCYVPQGEWGKTKEVIVTEDGKRTVKEREVITADDYIRKAYKGGWCYVNPKFKGIKLNRANRRGYEKEGKRYIGTTADVNSLYPSMMHSSSENYYPVGIPHWVKGKEILNYKLPKYYTFIRLKCRFILRTDKLPFIQIKGSPYYNGCEMLTDSQPSFKGKKYKRLKKEDGSEISDLVELTLTATDYKLFHEQYNVYDEDILDGCWFYTDIGLFDDYINHWMKVKKESAKGTANRAIAKLLLNSLYGRFALSPHNECKIIDIEGIDINMVPLIKEDKKPWYIPIGAAITSYARCFTIRAAQANYDYFCYADTDSIHCLCSIEDIQGIKIDPRELSCWKLESCWDEAIFARQKTYIEHITHEDEKPIQKSYHNIKCAGMPDKPKILLAISLSETEEEAKGHKKRAESLKASGKADGDEEYETERFLSIKRDLTDFKTGLQVPGKLLPQKIEGGIILKAGVYTLNERNHI